MDITVIICIIVVCITVLIMYAVYKHYDMENPYVDELVSYTPIGSPGNTTVTGHVYRYKRTYKNGKVIFVIKKVHN